MAATGTGVNVLRWGALAFGIFYGFSHQSAIRTSDRKAATQHEWDRQTKLIEDAKKAFSDKKNPQQGDGVITNPDDPKFDLEKYLTKVAKENPE
ncbi:F1F0 ATP synthase subunit e, mitochondrial [Extremus antarcticus]|uniref:ATP synthase F(0) complex subunit e, mitochondrial n=1 Tax=Extremus antarcticus TaxID=702011 RepID=A0AAJ0GDP1_9PEZI|nr:F1F0 ATP synthase subunit e, mitochondrial [Extremus antarcticus]